MTLACGYGRVAVSRWCLVLLLALSGGEIKSQSESQWSRYANLIERYRSGVSAVSVAQSSERPPRELLSALGVSSGKLFARLGGIVLQAATLFHTDLALHHWRRGDDREARAQIDVARRLADLSEGDPSSAAFRPRWYLAAGLLQAEVVTSNDVFVFFERASLALPDDASLLIAQAWLHERLAVSAYSTSDASLAQVQQLRKRHLAAVTRLSRAALRIDPLAVEASLRLARAELMGNNVDGARRVLEQVVSTPGIRKQDAYVARLLWANVCERTGRLDCVVEQLDQALVQIPTGQSARLALGLLYYEAGSIRRLNSALEPVLTTRPKVDDSIGNDPWSEYLLGPIGVGKAVWKDLRSEVRTQ